MEKRRLTRISQLEGRVIESAIIYPTDLDEGEEKHRGPTVEIRVSGGYYFSFTAAPAVRPYATTILSRQDATGNLRDLVERRFK